MPTQNQMDDFAQARIDRCASRIKPPSACALLQPAPPRRKGADSKRLKRIGGGYLYMRGADSRRQIASRYQSCRRDDSWAEDRPTAVTYMRVSGAAHIRAWNLDPDAYAAASSSRLSRRWCRAKCSIPTGPRRHGGPWGLWGAKIWSALKGQVSCRHAPGGGREANTGSAPEGDRRLARWRREDSTT